MSTKARYHYRCAKCGGPVTKEPTSKTVGLHGWRCAVDGSGVKVGRTLAKEKDNEQSS